MKPNQVRRFSFGELFLHWANAGLYLLLFLSGTLLLIGRIFAVQSLTAPWLGKTHRICGVMLVGILLIIFVLSLCLRSFREVWKTLRQCLKWSRHDILWLIRVPINMVYPKCTLPPVGRFNPGQKMHLLIVFGALIGFCISGPVMIWIPGALCAWVIHLMCFIPACAFLSLHLFLSLINPETRKALPAILTGFIGADYVRNHHPLWGVSRQEPARHGSYVSWENASLVGILVLIGLGNALALYGSDPFVDRLKALVHSRGATALTPGPLNVRHASEAELQSCRACHSLTQSVQDHACLDCHELIAERHQAQSGFHGTLQGPCRKCHKEHKGQGEPLIDLVAADFSHEKALFLLEGQHRDAACEDCHMQEEQDFSYIGIDFASCASCHADPHQDEQAAVCRECHTPDTWSYADKVFDHEREASFALKGKHRDLSCQACHGKQISPDESRIQLYGIGEACSDCHEDPHAAQFVQSCEQCHVEQDFKQTRPEQFHGDPNTFILKGKHLDLACTQCHKPPDGVQALAQARFVGLGRNCKDCHQDPHSEQFGQSCEHCHVEQNFQQIRPEQFHGAPNTFILKGKHQDLTCAQCHQPSEGIQTLAEARFVDLGQTCEDCHQDPHQEQMDHACARCHQETGFVGPDLLFVHDTHTQFKLDGLHQTLSCSTCHPAKDQRYEAAGRDCHNCHATEAQALKGRSSTLQLDPDPHFGRTACTDCHDLSTPRQSEESFAAGCASCHNSHYHTLFWSWKDTQVKQRDLLQSQIKLSAQTDEHRKLMEQKLSEATRIGFHHLQLSRQLFDQLQQGLKSAEGQNP
jgi:cytochrome b subunit of formate dehydrogenase